MNIGNHIKQFGKAFGRCGVAGWCMEVLFSCAGALEAGDPRLMGKTSLLMFPIYGCGAVLGPITRGVDQWIGGPLSDGDRMIRHGMIDMVLIFSAEYASGWWLKARGMCPWDYSGRPFNIDGLIRLDFAPLWFLTGLLFESLTRQRQRNACN